VKSDNWPLWETQTVARTLSLQGHSRELQRTSCKDFPPCMRSHIHTGVHMHTHCPHRHMCAHCYSFTLSDFTDTHVCTATHTVRLTLTHVCAQSLTHLVIYM
jgi:hypothetical protein